MAAPPSSSAPARRCGRAGRELHPESIGPGGLKFLHPVSRWQLATPLVNRDPLDPWFGEPTFYEVVAPTRGALQIHPSRVIRFLGNELPDPSLGVSVWSDSILQTLYDAIHAVALTNAGATSLMHEAKVDVVTVPNLSEHLSSAATTDQLSARFAYAAAMKSINNLLLLGDGESWARQKIDFAGLPEMVRTFLQVAAGAADIPVTRLLGQCPAGLRHRRQRHPQLLRHDLGPPGARPAAAARAPRHADPALRRPRPRRPHLRVPPPLADGRRRQSRVALQKAQTTQIYAGLGLWPGDVTARLVQAQLGEDGTYPGAEAVFSIRTAGDAPGLSASNAPATADAFPVPSGSAAYLTQPRDPDGRWTTSGGNAAGSTGGRGEIGSSQHHSGSAKPEVGRLNKRATSPPSTTTPPAGGTLPEAVQGPHAPDQLPDHARGFRQTAFSVTGARSRSPCWGRGASRAALAS